MQQLKQSLNFVLEKTKVINLEDAKETLTFEEILILNNLISKVENYSKVKNKDSIIDTNNFIDSAVEEIVRKIDNYSPFNK